MTDALAHELAVEQIDWWIRHRFTPTEALIAINVKTVDRQRHTWGHVAMHLNCLAWRLQPRGAA